MNRNFTLLPGTLLVFALACLSLGCRGGNVTVSGKATYKGQPVKAGTLVFSPVAKGDEANPGTPGGATIENGEFSVTLARAGKYRVVFTPPAAEATEEQLKDPKFNPPPSIYAGLAPKQAEVEIKAGTAVEIELDAPK